MIKFIAIKGDAKYNGEIIYSLSENTFDFTKEYSVDIMILINYLNLGIDSDNMELKCIWGFSYKPFWTECDLNVPAFSKGAIQLIDNKFESGHSYRLVDDKVWETYYDSQSGWCCVGKIDSAKEDCCIEFANNCIAVVNNNDLKALWMKPIFKE